MQKAMHLTHSVNHALAVGTALRALEAAAPLLWPARGRDPDDGGAGGDNGGEEPFPHKEIALRYLCLFSHEYHKPPPSRLPEFNDQ